MTSLWRRSELIVSPQPQRSVSSIRPANWADLRSLRRLRGETARLDMPEGVVTGIRPLRTALWGMVPWFGYAWTFVFTVEGQPQAFVQAQPRRGSHTWDVLYLAYGRHDRIGSAAARDHMWSALLDTVTRTAGRRRATRLFARVPDNADAMIALRDAGYMTYGREMLYVIPFHKTQEDLDDLDLPLQRQSGGDTWAIHQLYTLTTPKAQQFAEARTSSYWDLPSHGSSHAAYWIGEPHEITAYARTLSGEHTHLIDVLFRPEAHGLLGSFVRRVLAALPAGEGDLVYCRVLGFQEDLAGALESLGFSLLTRQSLLVKYTTISVREAVPAHAMLPARSRVPVQRRVPSLGTVITFPVRLWHRITRSPWPSHDGDLL